MIHILTKMPPNPQFYHNCGKNRCFLDAEHLSASSGLQRIAQPVANCIAKQIAVILQAHLLHQIGFVGADCLDRQVNLRRDVRHRGAAGQLAHHFKFARAQLFMRQNAWFCLRVQSQLSCKGLLNMGCTVLAVCYTLCCEGQRAVTASEPKLVTKLVLKLALKLTAKGV